ncbi:MAG: LPS export ABC transporter periplasmic protein LptC [Candidatus Omnitrophica bacterium]|nr:LPS export ABC transporter periplasmic protein LptC [Candidatus Omnitrophota bacterium]
MLYNKKYLIISFLVCSLICLVHSGILFAEELEGPIECNGDEIEYLEDEKKVIGKGHVIITYKDTVLTCDKVTVSTVTREAQAEGNVKIVQGSNYFTGESMTYNLEKEYGTVMNFRGYTDPWYAKGNEAKRTGPDEFIVSRGYVTTCDRENPHYRIAARKVLIYPNKKVVIKDATFRVGNVPLLWLPIYVHPLDDDRPRVTVIPGKSSEWGAYLLTSWRYNLDDSNKGYVHLDYREKKDFAGGVDYLYNTKTLGSGIVKTYYTKERSLKRKHIYTPSDEGEPTTEQEKYLAQWRHKWDASKDTTVTAELYKYKDKNFRKDYFFNEYEKDNDPKSYLLITKTQPIYNLSVLTEKRANRFEERVERLPEIRLEINNTRIGESRFYYEGEYSGVNLNKKYPSSTDDNPVADIANHHTNRYDTYNKLSYAGKLGFLNVTPYTGLRETYYQRGLNGEDYGSNSHVRGVFYTGVDISTKFFKVFNTQCSPLGMEINNLRHIITPSINYSYIPPPTTNSSSFFQFDEIDSIARNNTVGLTLENKLQTKRGKQQTAIDLARLGISTTYGFKHNPGSKFLDYTGVLELKPYSWLTFTSNTTIDPHKRYNHEWLKYIGTDVVASVKDFRLGLSHSYVPEQNNIVGQVEWRINPQWKIRAYESFDIKSQTGSSKKMHNLKEQRYVITKDLHCWEAELNYNVYRERGEEILLVFRIKAFPEIPFEYGKNYHEPKRGSQGSQTVN